MIQWICKCKDKERGWTREEREDFIMSLRLCCDYEAFTAYKYVIL